MSNVILSQINQGVGHIILNSEKTLNALNQEMADQLLTILNSWERDDNVLCIFLEGAGERAFCAGGDIKNLYHSLRQKSNNEIDSTCLNFFVSEYSLDYKIHTYLKPIITWNHGITMGGGMGLMNGARHRIVTETSLLAMPEISIGLYPDVGATYFLNQLPPGVGKFLALTGARINASDAIKLGLADYYIPSSSKPELLQELKKTINDQTSIHGLLLNLSAKELPPSNIEEYIPLLKALEPITNVFDFIKITQSLPQTPWFKKSLETFMQGSPTSAAVILKQLNLGKEMSLEEVFKSELNLSVRFSLQKDFPEGVRALLIDKDNSPNWSPPTHDDITPDWLESFFQPVWEEKDHPFKDL